MPDPRKSILWVDDEIDLLRSHIVYLNQRGYDVTPATNGPDALALAQAQAFDAALVDEIMPVMSGLEVMRRLKALRPDLPVVMVTKNEAEELMEQAIASPVDGFLTKPVNPSQILSVLMGLLERRRLAEASLSRRWPEEFADITRRLETELDADGWAELHLKLVNWELEVDRLGDPSLAAMLRDVRLDADRRLARFMEKSYPDWLASSPDTRPPLSPDVVPRFLIPALGQGPVLFLVMDCMRFDQWVTIEPLLAEQFEITRRVVWSILPTATPYSRNALFSGLLPVELERIQPDLWARGDEDEASSNRLERQLLTAWLRRRGIEFPAEPKYVKVLDADQAAEFEAKVHHYLQSPLTSLVYNFIDILIHTRQSVEVLREMIPDEAAYRSVVRAWFQHSSLFRILQAYGRAGGRVLVTSDHGSVRVARGAKVTADREASPGLRCKYGRNLKVDDRQALKIARPADWGLPARGLNTEYILAREDWFFVYPTNYHKFLSSYRHSFQHGGISLEEMVLPVVTLTGKG